MPCVGTTYPEECGAIFLKGTSRYPSTYDPPFIHPLRFAEGSRTVGLRSQTAKHSDRNATSIDDLCPEAREHG